MRKIAGRGIFSVCLLMSLSASPAAPPKASELVHATLLADRAAVAPGDAFTVGVLLRIKDGWHVYWENPGDAGLATKVRWSVPEGFAASGTRFPIPIKFQQAGDIVGYGYTDTVLLTAEIRAPSSIATQQVTVRAEVSWLACQESCIPGRASLELTLPVEVQPRPANAEVFGPWRQRLPVEAATASAIADVKSAATPSGDVLRCSIDIDFKSPVTQVEFFPATPDQLQVGDLVIRADGSRAHVDYTVRVRSGESPPAELRSVVAYGVADNQRRGLIVHQTLVFPQVSSK